MKVFEIILAISLEVLLLTTENNGQDVSFPECDPSRVTWHPHPYACTRYILCFHGNPIERLCAPGLHFSRFMEHCTFPQLAQCDINYACPKEDDYLNPIFLPDPDDCRNYFVCFKGEAIARECAEELWWDVTYSWCTLKEEVVCDSRVPNDPRDRTTTTNIPTEPPGTEPPLTELPPTQPPPTIMPTTTTTRNPNTYDCPLSSEPSFHPHSLDCSLYFICINGVAFLRQCAPKLFFDIISRACEAEDIAICISGDLVPEEPTLSVPNQPSGLQCPVAGAGEILYFPHRYNCNNFYTCERGIAYLRKCSPGEQYDVKSEVCMQSSEAVCLNAL